MEDGNEILEGNIYDLTELDAIDKGIAPVNATEDLDIIGDEGGFGWDVDVNDGLERNSVDIRIIYQIQSASSATPAPAVLPADRQNPSKKVLPLH